jgi:hypothetical protein
MKHLLNKDDLLKLYNSVENNNIFEKQVNSRVNWNQSALGILSNAVLRPISFLTGSIKKGINKSQIDTLIKQWGMEYVNGIKKYDTGNLDKNDAKEDDKQEDEKLSPEVIEKYTKLIQQDFEILKSLKPLIVELQNVKGIDAQNKFYLTVKDKVLNIDLNFENIIKLNNNITIPNSENLEEYVKFITNYINVFNESDDVKQFISNNGGIAEIYKKLKQTVNVLNNLEDIFDVTINELTDWENVKESYLINESEYKLPDDIKSIFPEKYLEEIKRLDAKKEITKLINVIRLNTIMYEANFIIDKVKGSKNDNSADLQRMWDVGIQNINDYFQDVIDVEFIMSSVSGKVDGGTKKTIENDQQKLSDLQNMKITELFPPGESFDENNLYCFDCSIIGTNKKEQQQNY